MCVCVCVCVRVCVCDWIRLRPCDLQWPNGTGSQNWLSITQTNLGSVSVWLNKKLNSHPELRLRLSRKVTFSSFFFFTNRTFKKKKICKKKKKKKKLTHGRRSSWTVSSGRVWRWLWSSCSGTIPLPACCPGRVAAAGRSASSCPGRRWTETWRRRTSDGGKQREWEWRRAGCVWRGDEACLWSLIQVSEDGGWFWWGEGLWFLEITPR